MTSVIDSTGMTLDSFSEAKDNALAKLRAKFGDNIKTDDQSLFGIIGTVLGEMVSDQNDLIRESVNARNPQGAQGLHLDNISQFNGVVRRAPEYSTVALSFTALTTGGTVPIGSLVQDPNDATIEFATDAELVLAADEEAEVSATATSAGAINAVAESLTKIVNPMFGISTVTNDAAAVAGRAVETDTDMRARRKMVSRQTGYQSLPKIYAALTNIASIGRVTVRENKTSYTDSLGQPAHSIWAVCQGGADSAIAAALHLGKSGGIGYYGGTTVAYADPITGRAYSIKFDRVTEVAVGMTLRLSKNAAYPADGDTQIQNAIVDYFAGDFVMPDGETNNGFSIAENVEYFRCLTPILSIGGHSVVSFTIGYKDDTMSTEDVHIGQTELAVISAGDIHIETF